MDVENPAGTISSRILAVCSEGAIPKCQSAGRSRERFGHDRISIRKPALECGTTVLLKENNQRVRWLSDAEESRLMVVLPKIGRSI